ncbi:MerR family transcriptional regulator [Staphylococcus warneri]|uniref:MerR family transcriptional regulator n=2 Tax=Staphylococcus warneri TaxID=1292 RepID=A0A2V3ZTU9_STAWA|nr:MULTISPECIES: MerR family transcriptional regulator [Staphylococcus]AGC90733.1 glutamine synthetase repressor [Staphylococcus warneri SG1]MBJ7884337.1 MerR family transcriptional regulator [Bacillaceae bacterium HSR45]POO68712.1 MerR family transcriptional regulator [Bacillus amyloliquefaciens]QAV31649.1 MerR family transcriptional regulator [Sulfitobacter donghicola]SKR87798.1 HspR protein [Mycobacteroides abscessus subsp. abscessus]HBO6125260.1 MerR family transcriptional regulator [Pseu
MSNDSIRRNMAVFSMSVVSKLTELSPRQIRYYETHELVKPERTEGNKRLFSLNDLERLLEIKSLIEKGFNIKGIKQIIHNQENHLSSDEHETRKKMIVDATQKPYGETLPINRGDLSRFIK